MADLTPRWPGADAAARHLSLRVDAFLRMVRDGRIPPCSLHLGPRTARWDREALDARNVEDAGHE